MIKNIFITLCSLLTCSAGFAQKPSDTPSNQMEKLDRGLIVVPMSNKHYISWRMFGTDDKGTTFEVLKNGVTLKKKHLWCYLYIYIGVSYRHLSSEGLSEWSVDRNDKHRGTLGEGISRTAT